MKGNILSAYYNEFDPKAAAWLRELIKAGHIADGEVDERSIVEVSATDLVGFTQCHFFAGIGGWSYAFRLAGWPDGRPVWSASLPCQPFSAAGKQKGEADERHLWPVFERLVKESRPTTIFGEQVASALGRQWLAGVRADLEALDYRVGLADLCAASVGAPHIRSRAWWVAYSSDERLQGRDGRPMGEPCQEQRTKGLGKDVRRLANADSDQSTSLTGDNGEVSQVSAGERAGERPAISIRDRGNGAERLGDASGEGLQERGSDGRLQPEARRSPQGEAAQLSSNPWTDAVLVPCADGKARRIKPGLEPLAHGVSGKLVVLRSGHVAQRLSKVPRTARRVSRVAALRGAGNAISPQVAAVFIQSAEQAIDETIRSKGDG